MPRLPFGPVAICTIGSVNDVPISWLARCELSRQGMKELVAYVRAQGDKVTYGNVGLGFEFPSCGLTVHERHTKPS